MFRASESLLQGLALCQLFVKDSLRVQFPVGIPAVLKQVTQLADNADAGAIVRQRDSPEPRVFRLGVHDKCRAFINAFVSVCAFKMRVKRCHFQVRFCRVHIQLPADEGALPRGIDDDSGMNRLFFSFCRVLRDDSHRRILFKKHLTHTGTAVDFYAFLRRILQKPLVEFTPQHLPRDSTFVRVRLKEIERLGGFPGT